VSSAILPPLPTVPVVAPKSAALAQPSPKDNFADMLDAANEQSPVADKPAAPEPEKLPDPMQDAAKDPAAAQDATQEPVEAPAADEAPAEGEVAADPAKPADPVEAADGDVADVSDDDAPTLDDLIDALAALDLNLQTGQPIDSALLDKLNAAAQALSALLGLTTPVDGTTTPAAGNGEATAAVDPASMLGQLTKKIGDLAATLNAASPDLAAKLDALAQKLGSGEISADMLAKLGFDAELKAADPAINQALTALVNTKTAAPKQAAPAIQAPELKLPETALLTPKDPVPMASAELAPPTTQATDDDASVSSTQDKAKEKVRTVANDMAKATVETGKDAKQTGPSDALNSAATPVGAGRTELPAAAARVVQAAYQGPPSPINLPHMAFEIARQVHAGSNKFQIRLDPADMGRVDVSLDIDKNGTVNARLVVEKMETLDLMQRDQRSLEKALQQAGLDSSKTNLEFSLKQNPSGGQNNGKGDGNGMPFGNGSGSGADDSVDAVPASVYRGSASPSGVNIFV
jgi:flagellar hook-length control protein FliK